MADVGNSMMIDAGYKRLDNLSFLFDDNFRVVFDEEGNFLTISDGSFTINLTNEEVAAFYAKLKDIRYGIETQNK